MKQNDNLKKAKELMEMVNNGLSKADFTASFKNVVDYIKRIDANLTQAVTALSKRLDEKTTASHQHLLKGIEDIKGQVNHVYVHERVSKMEREHAERMSVVDTKLKTIKNGDKGERGERGFTGRDGSSDTPDKIRDKISLLEGDKRLSIGHIHGLAEALEEGRKPRIADLTAIGVLRHQLTFYDLSPFLDGATTTFNLPSYQKIVQITLSSYPTILRAGIDYTFSNSPSTITFIGTIASNVATILSAGQTVIILMNS